LCNDTGYAHIYKSGRPNILNVFGARKPNVLRRIAKTCKGTSGKSLYFVRALSYCDINKIEMEDLKEILQTYPEFAEEFITKFQVTFDLKRVSIFNTCYL
jgi:hypothetical protein